MTDAAPSFQRLVAMAELVENWTYAECVAEARAVLDADLRRRAWLICGALIPGEPA